MADKLLDLRSGAWYATVVLTALSFTWSERWSTIGIILMILLWLLDPQLKTKILGLFQPRSVSSKGLMLVMLLFFLYHILGLLWSNDIESGWHSIEVKMTFFILPILFAAQEGFSAKRIRLLWILFSASLVLSFTYSFSQSFLAFHTKGWDYVLSRMNISEAIMHPGYYSNYFALALVWSVLSLKDETDLQRWQKLLLWFFVAFMLLALLLLISKTAMLFLACFFIWLLWLMAGRLQQGFRRWGVFLLFISAFALFASLLPSIRNRVQETTVQFEPPDKNMSIENSTGSRRVAWKLESDLILENMVIGYGTGEANTLLKDRLIQEGYLQLASDHMHTHNQMLHTWIDLGLPGLLLLLAFLLMAGWDAIKQQHTVAGWLVVLIAWNLVTDDMLEIQAGTVFFIFFLCLFLFRRQDQLIKQ